MTREIRNAVSVNTTQSILASSTVGVLTLNTLDGSGNPQTIRFYVATSTTRAVSIDTNGVYVGPLTLSGVTVNNFFCCLIRASIRFRLILQSLQV